jgi:FlaA1/EpsC-like NDP-sugar epimerase
MLTRVRALSRPTKRGVMLAADSISILLALWLAFALKFDSFESGLERSPWLYAGTTVASLVLFWVFGLYRSIVRYIGPRAMTAVVGGVAGSAALLYLLDRTVAENSVPFSVTIIYALIALTWVASSRYLARWLLLQPNATGENVAIYGAGEAGVRLARALNVGKGLGVVAFLDDKRVLHGSLIDSVPVHSAADLPRLIRTSNVTRVLLAVPTASRRRRADIIRRVEGHGVRVQTIPNLAEIASGRAPVDELREIDVADLLGRDPVPPNHRLLDACIRDKVVMVTGAGGSIGSELCRQIIRLGPARLVLFENSELALYNIERELRCALEESGAKVELVALLGNAHHKYRAREVIQAYGVQTLYHAAAYKHVPIVEQNVIEGIHNNVISTWYTAEAALECGVESFVLISTDKAVNPTNVMGATKRLAEMVLQGMHERGSRTRFCMVRFGNVLESSGSVVPLFREQIRKGGPVTVTHPDVIRYFMTIPEASQLVLQAGAMSKGSDVFVLDMGKPMKIADLARRMVNLSGLLVRDEDHPDGDVEIHFTGLRPAEKLYEELLIGNNVSGTEHPMILRAMEHSLPWPATQRVLQQLLVAMGQFDVKAARELLLQAVKEYRPNGELADLVWCSREQVRAVSQLASNVTSLPARRGVGMPRPEA